MALKKTGLGRGLSSLIPNRISKNAVEEDVVDNYNTPPSHPLSRGGADTPQSHSLRGEVAGLSGEDEKVFSDSEKLDGQRILEVAIDKIIANPFQPRYNFDHSSLEDLISSIKEHGILQPLVVTQKGENDYELIAGERRLRSAKIAGLECVPVIVRKADGQEKLELALIENIQRSDLNIIEEAMAYNKLVDEFTLTQDQISKKVGKSISVIANALRLLTLPEEIKEALSEGRIDKTAGRTLAGLSSEDEQLKLFRELIEKGLNVRKLERYVKRKKMNRPVRINLVDFESEEKMNILQDALGTKVKIDKKGDEGKIVIEFYSEEELAEIVRKITGEDGR
ncbi:ParB/RepB/Spo0J family partition protein [Patescibacteria group bacterium]